MTVFSPIFSKGFPKFLLPVFLCSLCLHARAQQVWDYYGKPEKGITVTGIVKGELSGQSGGSIKIYRDGKFFQEVFPNSNGQYEADLPYNSSYEMEFSVPGCVTKKITVETNLPTELQSKAQDPLAFNMSLPKASKGPLDEAYEVPVSRLFFDKTLGDFNRDMVAEEKFRSTLRAKQLEQKKWLEEEKAKEEAEKQKKREEELAKKKAEEEAARLKAEAEAKRKAEEAARLKAEADAKAAAEAAAKKKAEEEAARLKAEADAKAAAEAAAKKKAEEEARKKAEADAAEAAAKKKAEDEARKKAEIEAARLKAEADYQASVEAAAKKKAEEEARKKAEDEAARLKAEAAAEAAAKKKAEDEARKNAESEAARLKAEADAKAAAEAAAKKKAEAEAAAELAAQKKAEADAKRQAEEDAQRKAAEDAFKLKQKEEELKKLEELKKKQVADSLFKVNEKLLQEKMTADKEAERLRKEAEDQALLEKINSDKAALAEQRKKAIADSIYQENERIRLEKEQAEAEAQKIKNEEANAAYASPTPSYGGAGKAVFYQVDVSATDRMKDFSAIDRAENWKRIRREKQEAYWAKQERHKEEKERIKVRDTKKERDFMERQRMIEERRKMAIERNKQKEAQAEAVRQARLKETLDKKIVILVAYSSASMNNSTSKFYGYVNFGDGKGPIELTESEYKEMTLRFNGIYNKQP